MSEFSRANSITAANALLRKARDVESPDAVRNLLNTAFEYLKPFNMKLDDLVADQIKTEGGVDA